MPLQPSDIDRIATLARLRLSHAEQTSMLAQINDFFATVERMRAVDTTAVEPLAHPLSAAVELIWRSGVTRCQRTSIAISSSDSAA